MTRRRLSKTERRTHLLAAAAGHFRTRDYPDVSLTEVADDADASPALIFHHFSTKAGLYTALIDDALTHLHTRRGAALAALDDGQPVNYRIETLLKTHLAALAADPLLLPRPGEPAAAAETRNRADHDFAAQLSEAIGVGTFPRHRWAVHGIVGFVGAAAVLWQEKGFHDDERRPLLEAALGALEGGLGDWRV